MVSVTVEKIPTITNPATTAPILFNVFIRLVDFG
jgi:hypothetical protein